MATIFYTIDKGNAPYTVNLRKDTPTGLVVKGPDSVSVANVQQQFDNVSDGVYYIEVIDTTACINTELVNVNAVGAGTCALASITLTVTGPGGVGNGPNGPGASDAEIHVVAATLQGNITYQLNSLLPTQTSPIFPNLGAQTYTVTVFDDIAGGCSISDQVVVQDGDCTIDFTWIIDQPQSVGGDGTLTINVTGNQGTVEYSLDGGINRQTSNVFILPAGTYNVTVFDITISNCFNTKTGIIISDPGCNITIDSVDLTNPTDVGNGDGTFTIVASNAAGTIEYRLDGGTPQQSGFFPGVNVLPSPHVIEAIDGGVGNCSVQTTKPITNPFQILFDLGALTWRDRLGNIITPAGTPADPIPSDAVLDFRVISNGNAGAISNNEGSDSDANGLVLFPPGGTGGKYDFQIVENSNQTNVVGVLYDLSFYDNGDLITVFPTVSGNKLGQLNSVNDFDNFNGGNGGSDQENSFRFVNNDFGTDRLVEILLNTKFFSGDIETDRLSLWVRPPTVFQMSFQNITFNPAESPGNQVDNGTIIGFNVVGNGGTGGFTFPLTFNFKVTLNGVGAVPTGIAYAGSNPFDGQSGNQFITLGSKGIMTTPNSTISFTGGFATEWFYTTLTPGTNCFLTMTLELQAIDDLGATITFISQITKSVKDNTSC